MKCLLPLFLCLGLHATAQVSIPRLDHLSRDTAVPVPIHISAKGYSVGYNYYEYCTNVICFNDGMRVSVFNNDGDLVTTIRMEKPVNNTSTSSKLYVHDAAFDQNNDLILTGTFHSDIDFDPNHSTPTLITGNTQYSNTTDIFIAKYSIPGGKLKWVKVLRGSNNPISFFSHLTVDKSNNIYLLATKVNGTFDLDPGAGTVAVSDAFIARYGANGDYLTSKPAGKISTQYYQGLRFTNNRLFLLSNEDSAGKKTFSVRQYDPATLNVTRYKKFGLFDEDNISTGRRKTYDFVYGRQEIWLLGSCANTLTLPTATGAFNLSLDVYERAFFLAKLDTGWNVQEARLLQRTKNPYYCPVKLGVDSLNNLMVVGSVTDSVDADLGSGTQWIKSAAMYQSTGYMIYYDANFTLQWAKRFGETGNTNVMMAAFDADRYLYLNGTFKGTSNFSMTGTPASYTGVAGITNFYNARYIWPTAKPTGISGLTRSSVAKLYPNPADQFVYLSLAAASGTQGDVICTVYDAKGSMVRSQVIPAGTAQLQLPVGTLPPATYFLHLTDGVRINETHRFIKQ